MLQNLEAHEIVMSIVKQNVMDQAESENLYKIVFKE
jgi:hypothetical protein